MAIPILLPIIGLSVLSVLVSYVAIRLYKRIWHKSLLQWSKPKAKHDVLPITALPPPPTALPTTPPPLVDISYIPRTPVSFITKHLHTTRPPSPRPSLATTSPPKLRRSRSLGGVPVRRLSGGTSGLRNSQILDLDVEMQEINKDTSREHLLIDFSSSGSSDDLDTWRRQNGEGHIPSRMISPASSDIGVLPSRHPPSSFDHSNDATILDLAPGKKLVQLVDFDDVEHGLAIRQKDDDSWKWSSPLPPFTPLQSTTVPKLVSKSISEPLPITPLPPPMPEAKLIDFHSEHEEEHVLVDLNVQDDNNVPHQEQPEFIQVHRTRVDLTPPVTKPITPTELAVCVKQSDETPTATSPPEGGHNLDSLMKPVTITDNTTPHPVSAEIQNLNVVEESSQRGRRVDWHPLEEVHEVVKVSEKVEAGPIAATRTTMEIMNDDEKLVNEHENYELHDRYDDYSNAYNIHDHHSLQSLDTTPGEQLRSSSSPQVTTIPLQAAPAWYWDHEDDPWNTAVGVNEDVKDGECDMEEELLGGRQERGEIVEEDGDIGVDVSEKEAVREDEDLLKTSLGNKGPELPVECSHELETETHEEDSYPDPDYLPLPELLLGSSPSEASPEVPLVLVKNGHFQDDEHANENQLDDDEGQRLHQQCKENTGSPRRSAAQMPTPPASPPTTLRVKGLGTVNTRSGPPSPSSSSSTGGLLSMASILPLSAPQPPSPKLLTSPNTSELSPPMEVHLKTSEGDQGKENEIPSSTIGRPLWSMRASDAPALGLAASSLSSTTASSLTPSTGLTPSVGTNISVSPRMRRRVLGGIVENGEREQEEVEVKEVVKEAMSKEEKDKEDEDSSLPGAFPELLNPTTTSDTNPIIMPTIAIAALTSTIVSTSINAASSTSPTSTSTSSSTALETLSPVVQRRPRQHIVRSPLDIALAMQLRPGLGVGADPAWMVRFLMAMYGWFAILVSGQGEF